MLAWLACWRNACLASLPVASGKEVTRQSEILVNYDFNVRAFYCQCKIAYSRLEFARR